MIVQIYNSSVISLIEFDYTRLHTKKIFDLHIRCENFDVKTLICILDVTMTEI